MLSSLSGQADCHDLFFRNKSNSGHDEKFTYILQKAWLYILEMSIRKKKFVFAK